MGIVSIYELTCGIYQVFNLSQGNSNLSGGVKTLSQPLR